MKYLDLLKSVQTGTIPFSKCTKGYVYREPISVTPEAIANDTTLYAQNWRYGATPQLNRIQAYIDWLVPGFLTRMTYATKFFETLDPMEVFEPLYPPEHKDHDPVMYRGAKRIFYAHTNNPMDLFKPLSEYSSDNLNISNHDHALIKALKESLTTGVFKLPIGKFAANGFYNLDKQQDNTDGIPVEIPMMNDPVEEIGRYMALPEALTYPTVAHVPLTPFTVADRTSFSILMDFLGATDSRRMGLILRYFNLYPAHPTVIEFVGGKEPASGRERIPEDPRHDLYTYTLEKPEPIVN